MDQQRILHFIYFLKTLLADQKEQFEGLGMCFYNYTESHNVPCPFLRAASD